MKVTLTYDFKYRNWTCACLYPFEAGKRESMRWKMSSLCNWLHWHSQETNWKILHFKTACPAPFNAKGDLSSTHTDVTWYTPVGGTLTFFPAHALWHTQHVYSNCESLMHASVRVYELDVWEEERAGKTKSARSHTFRKCQCGAIHIWASLTLSV